MIHQRKMKAEEDEVDIDTISNPTGPSRRSASRLHASRSGGPGTGFVTPILTSGTNGHALLGVDGALGKLRSSSGHGDLLNIDLDAAWAEEESDDDDPGLWRMKVIMDNEEY